MSRIFEQVVRKDFPREVHTYNKLLLKLANHKAIGRSRTLGDVRITVNGVGVVSKVKIQKQLKGQLQLIAIGAIEAINDARHKLHDVKKFEWDRYSNEGKDMKEFTKDYHSAPGSRELEEYIFKRPDPNLAALSRIDPTLPSNDFDLISSSPDIEPLSPLFYDKSVVENLTKMFEFFDEKQLDFKFMFENFENIDDYLADKNIDVTELADEFDSKFGGRARELVARYGDNWNDGGLFQQIAEANKSVIGTKSFKNIPRQDPWFRGEGDGFAPRFVKKFMRRMKIEELKKGGSSKDRELAKSSKAKEGVQEILNKIQAISEAGDNFEEYLDSDTAETLSEVLEFPGDEQGSNISLNNKEGDAKETTTTEGEVSSSEEEANEKK